MLLFSGIKLLGTVCTILRVEPWSQQLLFCFTISSFCRFDVIIHRDAPRAILPLHAHMTDLMAKVMLSYDILNDVAINLGRNKKHEAASSFCYLQPHLYRET